MLRTAWAMILLVGCTARGPETPTSEKVESLDGASWSVPDPQCSPMQSAHTEVGEDGSVSQTCHVGGDLDGRFVKWHPSGQKAAEGAYVKGQRQGRWAWWHANGKLAARGSFEAGEEVGVWTWWHANGQTETRGDHIDGKRAGMWTSWYATGTRRAEGHYRNGKKDGDWSYWTEEGEPEKLEVYDLGTLQKEKLLPAGRRKAREAAAAE